MTRVLAVDPGTVQSAYLLLWRGRPVRGSFGIADNAEIAASLPQWLSGVDVLAVEQVESYGMPVGREVFETVRWAGRFEQAAQPWAVRLVPRRAVKLAVCGDTRANDASIRTALVDRYGGKAAAVGTKAAPGPLYGIHRDVWSALAIAVTVHDQIAKAAEGGTE